MRNEERLFLHRLVRFQEMASPSRVKQFMEDQGLVRAIAFNIRLPRGKTQFVFSALAFRCYNLSRLVFCVTLKNALYGVDR